MLRKSETSTIIPGMCCRDAFGEQESMPVIERLNGSIERSYSDVIQPRPDLSYMPAK